MAEEEELFSSAKPQPGGAAEAIALGAHAPLDPRAAAYLEEQTRLARLQSQNLVELNAFEISHLRWRRFTDQMRGALQILVVLMAAAFVAGLGVVVWNAAHEDGLVIEAFSVPPDMASRGLTGDAVAAQLQDKLAAMQDATVSVRPAESYANNWGKDIKVEIPDTGVSVGEFYRMLVATLGRQTHITGEVYRTESGIAVTARAGGEGGTASGAAADFDTLLQAAAEKIYQRTQPYRYAVYIGHGEHAQPAKARAQLEDLALEGSVRDRAWAHIGIGNLALITGDWREADAEQHAALALVPTLALAYINLDAGEAGFGHDEASLENARKAIDLLQSGRDVDMRERTRIISLPVEQSNVAFALNDFNAAIAYGRQAAALPDSDGDVETARETIFSALVLLHDGAGARQAWRDLPPTSDQTALATRAAAHLGLDYWLGDWSSVLATLKPTQDAFVKAGIASGNTDMFGDDFFARQFWPYAATAMAEMGNFTNAHALIDKTPTDCYTCLRNRGEIDRLQKNWDGAAYWFARAIRSAPSIPLGYAEWGRMLLAKGDPSGAIAKFAVANQKGPHFADPLELWGEALIAENRSDLALAKFEEAAKYAPNWGRLHLKWGEALYWSGNKDEAQKQFAIASYLDLAPSEKSQLTAVRHG